MLSNISWQQYLTAVFLLTAVWYAFVLARYYRAELAGRLKNKTAPSSLVSSTPVMGAVKTDYEARSPEELYFGSAAPDDIGNTSRPPGPTEELLAETQILVQAFRDAPNKTEFLSLLGVLLSKYEPYQDEIDLKVIRPLAAQLPFPIEEHEWPTL
jgi:hypothetical protein